MKFVVAFVNVNTLVSESYEVIIPFVVSILDELYKIQKVHKSRKIYSVPYYYISSINNNKIIDKKYYDNDLQYIPDRSTWYGHVKE